jgi:tetratricopeptide (TPR) repeat protein
MNKNVIISIFFIPVGLMAQSPQAEKDIQAGNEFYKQQQYDKAAAEYKKVIDADPSNGKAKFNLANALTKQGRQGEAMRSFTEIADNTKEADLKSKAFYNKGAILSQQKRLEESIEVYKNALRQNPEDKEARENLQKALLELKKKPPPPKKQDQKKQDQKKNKQPPPRMDRKEAEQRLKLLEQKEKEVQQRLQKEKSKTGGSQTKDW